MRKIIPFIIFFTFLACKSQQVDSTMWKSSKSKVAKTDYSPSNFTQYDLDKQVLTNQLKACGDDKTDSRTIMIPDPEGNLKEFIIWKSKVANPALIEKFPDLQTYQGVSKDSDAIRIRIENKDNGMMAMILGGENTYYVTPAKDKAETHIVFYKKDIPAEAKAFWSDKVLKENE